MSKKPLSKNPFNPELRNEVEREEHWVSVSDLMAGLMMVFLLVAVVYMVQLEIETQNARRSGALRPFANPVVPRSAGRVWPRSTPMGRGAESGSQPEFL